MHVEIQTQLCYLQQPEELPGQLGSIRSDSMVFEGLGGGGGGGGGWWGVGVGGFRRSSLSVR
jgi:hypothetical protein